MHQMGSSGATYYQWLVNPNVVVFDIRGVSDRKSQADVMRTLFQAASALKDRKFNSVVLSYRGNPKFILTGDYFQNLGREYGVQNPVYSIRTLPENVLDLTGEKVFGKWTGGLLGVTARQMDDVKEFNRRWFLEGD